MQIQFELVVAGGGAAHVRWDTTSYTVHVHMGTVCTLYTVHTIERVAAGPR